MWYAKMYFSEKKEVFQFDSHGIQGVPLTYKELPFLESLLSFLEMDCGELTPALRGVAENWERLLQEDDREAGTAAMTELGQLKSRHIYLELLYVRCYDRFSRMGAGIQVSEQEMCIRDSSLESVLLVQLLKHILKRAESASG